MQRCGVVSLCHGSKISGGSITTAGSQQTVILQTWLKNENIEMYDFPVYDCT